MKNNLQELRGHRWFDEDMEKSRDTSPAAWLMWAMYCVCRQPRKERVGRDTYRAVYADDWQEAIRLFDEMHKADRVLRKDKP